MRKKIINQHDVVDIHCHVMPGVDDGAKDMNEALEMISIAEKEGITKIICTPHFKSQHRNVSGEQLVENFQHLKEESAKAGNKVQLYLGNEVFYFRDLEEKISQEKIQFMNGSDYLLVEFHPKDSYQHIRNALDEIAAMDILPVLAHIERYECIASRLEYVEELHRLGVRLQINASSVTGKSGLKIRHFTKEVLKRQLVDYIATDSHSKSGRAPLMKNCIDNLYKRYDEQYVRQILYGNAVRDFNLA